MEDAEPAREHRWRRPLALIGGAALVLLVAGVLVLGFVLVGCGLMLPVVGWKFGNLFLE